MRGKPNNSLLVVGLLAGGLVVAAPAAAQNFSQSQSQGQQPSQQEIERFCTNWAQLSDSEQRQYQAQYERYCDRPSLQPETTIIQPVEPEQPQPQQQQPQQQKPQEPEKPGKPEEPAEPEAPEPEIEPTRPEPAIPEPEPRRVDLVGEVALAGPLASQSGERQRLRVTVENRGFDVPGSNRLWARVFVSERDASRRQGVGGGPHRGQPVRLPGVPGPGQARSVRAEVPVPVSLEPGEYWWCVRVDSRQAIQETDEGNNIACAQKVVAIGRDQDSDSKLSGLFGSKVDGLKTNEAIAEETGARDFGDLIASLPANIQPAVERMSTLFVNDSLTPGRVPEGGTAEVTWKIPPDERPDGLWLMVSVGTLDGSDCSGDLVSRFGDHPDAGRYAPDGDPVELQLEHYRPGFRYNLIGCYWRDGFFTGDWTNLVSFQYGATSSLSLDTTPDPRGEAERAVDKAIEDAVKPDLVVDMISITSQGNIVFAVENASDNLGQWQRWARTYYASRDADIARTPPVHMLGDQPLYRYTYRVFVDGERAHGDREGRTGSLLRDDWRLLLAGIRDVAKTDIKIPADGAQHEVRVVVNPEGHDTPFPYEETDYGNNDLVASHGWQVPVTLRLDLDGLEFYVESTGDTSAPGELQQIELYLCQVDGECSHTGEDIGLEKEGVGPSGRVNIYRGTIVTPHYGAEHLELRNVMPSNRFYLNIYAYDHDKGVGANRGEGGFSRFEFEFPSDMLTDAVHSERRCAFDHKLVLHGRDGIYSGARKGPHLRPMQASICVYRAEDP